MTTILDNMEQLDITDEQAAKLVELEIIYLDPETGFYLLNPIFYRTVTDRMMQRTVEATWDDVRIALLTHFGVSIGGNDDQHDG